MTTTIQQFMTAEELNAYSTAAALSAANEPDRAAWIAAISAENNAKSRAIAQYAGEVKLNRHGQPAGGTHPAISRLGGFLNISGCYASE